MSGKIQKVVQIRKSLLKLNKDIGKVRIGSKNQFPFGWRKAAKGRTVWRILEEIIVQNLEKDFKKYGLAYAKAASSEVGVYDVEVKISSKSNPIFINIKSSVKGKKEGKDDISKTKGLLDFFKSQKKCDLFIATFEIEFNKDMSISFDNCFVLPIIWLPDIYVNPSNNGNLQSSKYKHLKTAKKRTQKEFIDELKKEIGTAEKKKVKKKK